MRKPEPQEVKSSVLMQEFYRADLRGVFEKRHGTNQQWQHMRRIGVVIENLEKYLPAPTTVPTPKVVDLGCGTADVGLILAEKGYDVDLVDREKLFLDYAKLKYEKGKVQFLNLTLEDLVKDQKSYDAVYMGEVLEHIAEPENFLRQIFSILKPGGLLCLTTPNGDFVDCYEENWDAVKDKHERNQKLANTLGNHVCEFTVKELKQMVKEVGYVILDHKLINSAFICRRNVIRRFIPKSLIWKWDDYSSQVKVGNGKTQGKTQIVLAVRQSDFGSAQKN